MNIYIHEMKAYRKSTIVWTGTLVMLVILFMSMFPSISKEIEGFAKVMEGFPEGVRDAFGIQVETMGSINGYYSYIFLYLSLCGSIQGMNLGISIISKEIRNKTADFLFTRPVKRSKILVSKFLAAVTAILVTNLIFIPIASIIANLVKNENFNFTVFLLISLTLLFVQLIFLAFGILVSVIFLKIKSVTTVSLSIVFTFFIIGMIVASDGKEAGRYLSPFKYFDTAYIMENVSYEVSFVVTAIGVMIISLLTSFYIYTKRDIHTV